MTSCFSGHNVETVLINCPRARFSSSMERNADSLHGWVFQEYTYMKIMTTKIKRNAREPILCLR